MTIEELLALEPKSILADVSEIPALFMDDDLLESNFWYSPNSEFLKNSGRFEVHEFYHWDMDHRRFWSLAGIKFDSKWVAITQCAGRSGDDHRRVFILNEDGYNGLILFMKMIVVWVEHTKNPKDHPVRTMADSADDLFTFYNEDVRQTFSRW